MMVEKAGKKAVKKLKCPNCGSTILAGMKTCPHCKAYTTAHLHWIRSAKKGFWGDKITPRGPRV